MAVIFCMRVLTKSKGRLHAAAKKPAMKEPPRVAEAANGEGGQGGWGGHVSSGAGGRFLLAMAEIKA